MSCFSYTYKSVPEAEEDGPPLVETLNVSNENFRSRYKCKLFGYQIWCLCIWSILLTISLWAAAIATTGMQHASRLAPLHLGLHCGSSVAEAQKRGCEFDLLSYSWTPVECIDHETAAEFTEWAGSDERKLGPWPFFEDLNARIRVPDTDSLSVRVGVETRSSQEQHLGHCIFWMRRMDRIREGKGRLTARGDGLKHTMHCTTSLLDRLQGPNPKDEGQAHAGSVWVSIHAS